MTIKHTVLENEVLVQLSDIQRDTLLALLNLLVRSDAPEWYKTIFSRAGVSIPKLTKSDFRLEQLPIITWNDLARAPLKKRLYTREPYFPKVVKRDGESAIIAVSIPHIEREQYGTIGDRPFVAARHITDAMELGIFCYGQNRLPLLSEKNNLLSVQLAKRYAVDSLLIRTDCFRELFPPLMEAIDPSSLRHLSIIGVAFPPDLLALLASYHEKVSLIVSPREAGSCAASCPEWIRGETPLFHSEPEVIAEIENTLIVTKLRQLPTPLIRYDTGIPVEIIESRCSCGRPSFAVHD